MNSSRYNNQKGNFTIEFAMIGIFFSLIIAFSGDVIIKLSLKGKLDRMTYSAVSIIKERTELFDEEYEIDEAEKEEGQNTYKYVSASLARTISDFDASKFGYILEVFTYDGSSLTTEIPFQTGIACTRSTPTDDMLITTGWGRSLTLYQVTLCYQTSNWFGDLVGETYDRVQSYALMMGR